jgi:hypothetical protein
MMLTPHFQPCLRVMPDLVHVTRQLHYTNNMTI